MYNYMVKDLLKKMGLMEHGRNSKYYDITTYSDNAVIDKERNFDYGLKVWRGFKTSVKLYADQPLLLIDFSSRVIRKETALDFFRSYKSLDQAREEMEGLHVISSYGNH